MFYLFALFCCSCIIWRFAPNGSTLANEVCARTAFGVEGYGSAVSSIYYGKDELLVETPHRVFSSVSSWLAACRSQLYSFNATERPWPDELTIYETLKIENLNPLEVEEAVYITNYSIHHKTYSIHSTKPLDSLPMAAREPNGSLPMAAREPNGSQLRSTGDEERLIKQYTDSASGNKLLRKIIFAELRGIFGKEDVTALVKSAQGLKCDFHKEILSTLLIQPIQWDHILYEYDLDAWDVLTLVDSFGHIHNIRIQDDRVINWNPEFVL